MIQEFSPDLVVYDHRRFHRLRSLEARNVARHDGHICPANYVWIEDDFYDVYHLPYGCED